VKAKLRKLETILEKLPMSALAFSGGADSSFLLAMMKKTSPYPVTAFTINSHFVPDEEIDSARRFAQKTGVNHVCLDIDVFKNQNIILNSEERCYFCKKHIFSIIKDAAEERGITSLMHGVNLDDLNDFRPGLKAADELGFQTPLVHAGLTKKDIREYSRQMGLETWNKPSESCLATRIAYDEEITVQKLEIAGRAEKLLKDLKFTNVRVRCLGRTARIEVAQEQIKRFMDDNMRRQISQQFAGLGFKNTSVDIDGY